MGRTLATAAALLLAAAAAATAQTGYLWRAATGGQIRSRPAVGPDGTTYALSEDSYLYAWIKGGSLEWRHELGWLPWDCLAVSPDGTVYAGLKNGDFIAVNQRGNRLWTVRLDGLPAADPAITSEGTVLVGTTAGTLSAFSHLGRRLWSVTLPGAVTQAPVIDGAGTIYVVAADGRLYALAPWGDFKWSLPFTAAPTAPAIAEGGIVIVGTWDGDVCAVSPAGDILWKAPAGAPVVGVSAWKGVVAADTAPGTVLLFSPDGKVTATFSAGQALAASPTVDGARLLLTTTDGSILAADPASGVRSRFRAGAQGASLLTSAGSILLGGRDWVVYAVDRAALGLGAAQAPSAPWPQAGHDEMHTGRTDAAPPVDNEALVEASPDWLYLQGLMAAGGREGIRLVLDEVTSRMAGPGLGKSSWYVVHLLEGVVGAGILVQVRENQRLVNNFPDLRAAAAALLARTGTTASRATLLSAVSAETDGVALAAEIRALGAIASDADGASSRAIASAMVRRAALAPDPRLASAVIDALSRISVYQGGLTEQSSVMALLSITRGSYSQAVKAQAYAALQGDLKVDILHQEE